MIKLKLPNLKLFLIKYKLHVAVALISTVLTFIFAFNLGVTTSYHKILDWVLGGNVISIGQIFSEQFDNKYKLTLERIGNTDIFIAYSNTSPNSLAEDADIYDKKASPLIITQNAETKGINAIYEITFRLKENPNEDSGNIIFPQTVEFKDINGDSKKELITRWSITWGGSGGLMGMAIFELKDDILVPFTGYPQDISMEGENIIITDRFSKDQITLPAISISTYTNLWDLNNDKVPEFLFGEYEWQKGEAHFGEHYWNLQVFELKDGRYQIANWWNEGKTLKTSKKYGFFEYGGIPTVGELMTEFNSKSTDPEIDLKAEVKAVTNQENTTDYKLDIKYPQLIIKQNDNPAYSSINNDIKKIAESELSLFKRSITPVNSSAGVGIQNTFYLSYEIANLTDSIYSLEINSEHFYNGAAHPLHYIFTYNYDFKKKKVMNITDLLINPKSLDRISYIAINKLENNFKANGQYYDALEMRIKNGANPDIKNYEHFLIKNSGLEILFDEYQVASYAEGQPRVFIPYEEIKDLLSLEYIFLIKK